MNNKVLAILYFIVGAIQLVPPVKLYHAWFSGAFITYGIVCLFRKD
jgi:hypothetical protein